MGLCAVAAFVLSFQLKTRRNIIALNAVSRIFYLLQYVLLGAYEGAAFDMVAFAVVLFCQNRDKGFIKKHFTLVFILCNAVIVGTGLALYRNIFSLLPMFGVVFETLALWLRRERGIRIVSLASVPFWFAYNLVSLAYGSIVGNVIAIFSIGIAILRYDILKKSEPTQIADGEAQNAQNCTQ